MIGWIAGLMVLLLLPLASAQNFQSCPVGGMMYGQYGTGVALFSWLFSLLAVVALILLIVWLLKQIKKR